MVQFNTEAGQTRDYCVAKNATLRAARSDPSLGKKRLLQDDIELRHHRAGRCLCAFVGKDEYVAGKIGSQGGFLVIAVQDAVLPLK